MKQRKNKMAKHESKTFWKGIEEREQSPEFLRTLENEFPDPLPIDDLLNSVQKSNNPFSRRSFLKASGFSIAAAVLNACARGPVDKAIPLLNRAELSTPGKSYWYASTCHGCNAACGIQVKSRDGRPIKIEGNENHPLSDGGVCAVGQAMVLGLYDAHRLQKPLLNNKKSDWLTVDQFVKDKLNKINQPVYFVTGTISSPLTRYWINRFLDKFKEGRHIQYDALSYAALLEAHSKTHGARVLPHYHFDRAEVIVSFNADFLGTWISPVEFTKAYMKTRRLKEKMPSMSYHVQFEGKMSLTGTNADVRVKTSSGELGQILLYFARVLAKKAGKNLRLPEADLNINNIKHAELDKIIDRLWKAAGKSLVICGNNDLQLQFLANTINQLLGNYEKTLSVRYPSYQRQSNDFEIQKLISEMEAGRVGGLFIYGTNPVYSLPNGRQFGQAMQDLPFTVNFNGYADETAVHSHVVCPTPHFLETWADSEPAAGLLSVTQPLIQRLAETRTVNECLANWLNTPASDYELMQIFWQNKIFPEQKEFKDFQSFWDKTVENGFTNINKPPVQDLKFNEHALSAFVWEVAPTKTDDFELALYPKLGMLNGQHAQNPWLQELPDPVTKAVWTNYVCMAPVSAKKLKLQQGDIVQVTDGKYRIELPVLLQPGQHEGVLAVAVGYGCKGTERFHNMGPDWICKRPTVESGQTVGENAFPFAKWNQGLINFSTNVQIHSTGKKTFIALTQTHQTINVPEKLGGERRNLVHETTFAKYAKNPAAGNQKEHKILQLWPNDHVYNGHHWAMVIDLSKCTGCSACVISCQAENNVPVVGRDEVYRRREMHWLRIDRYYSGNDSDVEVIHQPVMCHHCDHAPCENVCPVLATLHSDEGINQQIYNRCVGTRYCANNCPYKVRRFNWFNYRKRDNRENLVLNPDVTVRTRGIMEKCSLCVQRIQEAKAEARRQGKPLADGDIKLACEQSCPAGAIVFGDMNDPQSKVSSFIQDSRHYRMLEEFNFRPSVGYLTLVRNNDG